MTEFREMYFDYLASLKSMLDVCDYELKERLATMIGCFYLAMFSYMVQVWNKQGIVLPRGEFFFFFFNIFIGV